MEEKNQNYRGGARPAMETWANGTELHPDPRGLGDVTQQRHGQQAGHGPAAGSGAQGAGRARGGNLAREATLRCARTYPRPAREGGVRGAPPARLA